MSTGPFRLGSEAARIRDYPSPKDLRKPRALFGRDRVISAIEVCKRSADSEDHRLHREFLHQAAGEHVRESTKVRQPEMAKFQP
jgi:hypothetical protein